MISKADFKKLLSTSDDAQRICREHLFSSVVWLLEQKTPGKSPQVYDQIKLFFADRLQISNSDVSIVGSAKLGFSLSPGENFRDFDTEKSDIDVVLVSSKLFHVFWDELLRMFYSSETYVYETHFRSVFQKYVTLHDTFMPPSTPIREWQQKVGNLKKRFFRRI